MTRVHLLRLVSAALVVPAPALAWGPTGHRIVARLAEGRLTPVARAGVRSLLGAETLAAASTWADDVKQTRPSTAHWHFTDIPLRSDRYVPSRDCRDSPRGDCAVAAIARQRDTLGDRARSRRQRTEAVRFLVHLVADLHQPLHSADDGDHGGNDVDVRFFADDRRLHAVWDSGIIERAHLTEATWVRRLDSWLGGQDVVALARGSVVDWTLEAHRFAQQRAYRDPDGRRIRTGDQLDQAYYEASRPVVDRQLARAGVRLARILNETFAHAAEP